MYRDKISILPENECTCDSLQTPSLGEAIFDHLEEKRRKRGSTQFPQDLFTFSKDIALRPVQMGWKFGGQIEDEDIDNIQIETISITNPNERRASLKQVKRKLIENELKY